MEGIWTTGVSLVDINADGLLDIYLCKSGPPGGNRRHNELFINNGDLTFTEKAKDMGWLLRDFQRMRLFLTMIKMVIWTVTC